MPDAVRLAVIVIASTFLPVGGYYRILSQRGGERLDRTKEGWPILIGIRFFGLLALASVVALLWNPAALEWAQIPAPEAARWVGVAGFSAAVVWLIWMFRSLGRNLTDAVVVRRHAYFVDQGPYSYVRNPMYTGVLAAGWAGVTNMGNACRSQAAASPTHADRRNVLDRTIRRSIPQLQEARGKVRAAITTQAVGIFAEIVAVALLERISEPGKRSALHAVAVRTTHYGAVASVSCPRGQVGRVR